MAVGAGILLSRLLGFVRVRAIGSYLGLGPHADVLNAAMRAPNALQVLLGEGTLSASIIPIYARLLAEGREREAGRFAGAILGLLAAVTAGAVLLGVLLARPLVGLLAGGFLADAAQVAAGAATVDRYELSVRAVRIIFPMTGFLVLSVWSLAILNSHRRFFLSYAAPAVWNLAILAALFLAGRAAAGPASLDQLLFAACWGALAGGILQFLVQLPFVLSLLKGFRPALSLEVPGVREAKNAFLPLLLGRGVVQLGGYLDLFLASFLAAGAVAALGPAQYLYLLPISLFGMSVAAAELPELASQASQELSPGFLARVRDGLMQVAFLVLPTMVGYLGFGWLIVAALYRTGRFGAEDTWLVYLVLAGYSLGLPASTSSRLLQNTFYALGETRKPARIAMVRVGVAALAAAGLMLWLDRLPVAALVPGLASREHRLGALGLSLASALGAWVELSWLRLSLGRRLPGFAFPASQIRRMAWVALLAALPAGLAWWALARLPGFLVLAGVVGSYALGYFALSSLAGVSQAERWLGRLRRRPAR